MNQAQPEHNSLESNLLEQSLDWVCSRSPVIKRTIDEYGELSLAEYLRQTLVFSENPIQPRQDLLETVYCYVAPLLGEAVAEKTVQELDALPAVLTANHHGVDFLAQSVQSSLIFSLREVGGKPAKTVPVFACGNVPLNNPSYPRGLLLYDVNPHEKEFRLPIKLPVFSDKHKRKSVSVVSGFDSQMLDRAERRLAKIVQDGKLNPTLAAAARTILGDYRSSMVLKLHGYSQQAVVLNNHIWKRCFREPELAPEMVYLELEKITCRLLEKDLVNEDSLVWQIIFNPTLRTKVLSRLDHTRACWDLSKLAKRVHPKPGSNESYANGCGTVFFWILDGADVRVPLHITGESSRTPMLQGRDDHGELWTVELSTQNICEGLRTKRLLPSLFICYLTIGFARGISCCGGYFQADYLQAMQRGIIKVLYEPPDCEGTVKRLSDVISDINISGMQTVMRNLDDNFLLVAGQIEIIANGGLSQNQLKWIHNISVQDAYLAGLTETLPDVQHQTDRLDNWYALFAKESNHLLKEKILII